MLEWWGVVQPSNIIWVIILLIVLKTGNMVIGFFQCPYKAKGQPMRRRKAFFLIPPCIFALLYCKLHSLAFKCSMSKSKHLQSTCAQSQLARGRKEQYIALLLSAPTASRPSHPRLSDPRIFQWIAMQESERYSHIPPQRLITPLAAFVQERPWGWWLETRTLQSCRNSGYFCQGLIPYFAHFALTSKITHPETGRYNSQMKVRFRCS